jgi:hypothetical protein
MVHTGVQKQERERESDNVVTTNTTILFFSWDPSKHEQSQDQDQSRQMKLKRRSILILAVTATLAIVWMTQTKTRVGNRTILPSSSFSADKKTHYIVYQTPNKQKVFLRVAVREPGYFTGMMLLSHEQDKQSIKAVDVLVRGKTMRGRTAVTGIRALKPQTSEGSPWVEYIVLYSQLSNLVKDDPILRFEWVSFDIELNFPFTASNSEKRGFLNQMMGGLPLFFLTMEGIDRVPGDDALFMESMSNVAPRPSS